MRIIIGRGLEVVLFSLAALAFASNVSAQHFWAGGAFGSLTDEWVASGTINQWGDDEFGVLSPPGAADFAVILDDEASGTSLLPYPHLRTDVGTVGLMTLAPNRGDVAELTIETGGSLLVVGDVHLAEDQQSGGIGVGMGTLFMTGGDLIVTGNMFVGQDTGQGQIDLDSGFVQATTVSFGASGNIDLELGAFFFLDGDQTASVPGWITDGSLTAEDGAGTVGAVYDGGSDRTVVTAQSGGLAGDYNDNGFVDAADYTAWLDNLGAAAGTLPNDVDGGVIGQPQYVTWKGGFGGSSVGTSTGQAVPEPASMALCGLALVGLAGLRRSRR